MKVTAAKAWAAAIGGTCTAILLFLGILNPALEDGEISTAEVVPLIAGIVTLASTVYAVWRVRNKPVTSTNGDQQKV